MNKNLQEINIQNMDTELVAQMFKNYQSNVLFHLEGMRHNRVYDEGQLLILPSYQRLERPSMRWHRNHYVAWAGVCMCLVAGDVAISKQYFGFWYMI